MLQNQKLAETSVDAKTAEMALTLAIRLQHERGALISFAELQRTADEAGIDRESLQQALDQLTAETTVAQADLGRRPTGAAPMLVLCAAILTAISVALPPDIKLAIALKIMGGAGFMAACFLFIRFLRRQKRI